MTTLHRDSWEQYAAICEKQIAEQQAEIERLRAALDPFVRHAHCVDKIKPSSLVLWCARALNAVSADNSA